MDVKKTGARRYRQREKVLIGTANRVSPEKYILQPDFCRRQVREIYALRICHKNLAGEDIVGLRSAEATDVASIERRKFIFFSQTATSTTMSCFITSASVSTSCTDSRWKNRYVFLAFGEFGGLDFPRHVSFIRIRPIGTNRAVIFHFSLR